MPKVRASPLYGLAINSKTDLPAQGMVELIKKDSEKSLDDLF
jgi:hypothetical protein